MTPGDTVHCASSGGGSPLPHPAAAPSAARASRAAIRRGMGGMLRPPTTVTAVRRSAYDREIVSLALPALGALAAEPLYLLADTAIVGHLGTPQLAALALAATTLSSLVSLCIFLTYGTTARVTRLHGAGQDRAADALASQALWLALAVGVTVTAFVVAFAHQLIALLGGEGDVAAMAVRYLRIASLGVPCALVALAGQGWLRGVGNLRTPLVIIVVANVVNVVLEVLFVYGFDWGLDGSAWGTVIAQAGMGIAFVTVLLARARGAAPRTASASARSSRSAPSCSSARPRCSAASSSRPRSARASAQASLGAHQIAFQLFGFLALVLDAIAIAGQVIVGRALGASDTEARVRRRPADARVVGGRRGPHRRRPPRADRRHPARVHERPRGDSSART